MLRWLVLCLVVSSAHARPRVMPFLPTPGVRLPGNVQAAAFCPTSQRAIFRTDKGLVSVDGNRNLVEIATLPVGFPPALMICDAKDRIYLGANQKLATVENGQVKVEKFAGDIRDLRKLADGTLVILDGMGNVVRWDGNGVTTPLWQQGRVAIAMSWLDANAEKVVSTFGGRVEVKTKAGETMFGPSALFAVWLDDKTILFSDRTGLVARWAIDAPASEWYKVDQVPSLARFIRTQLYRAGKRFVVERLDGVMRTISIDGKGVASGASITRVPLGRRLVAAGDAPFAVVAVNDRAFVIDLTRPAQAIDISLPGGPVDFMAFSPDGRELAMLAGQDVVVSSIDRSASRRLVLPGFARGPLLWSGDGTLHVTNTAVQARFNPDGTIEQRNTRAVGFTSTGAPVIVTRDQRIVIDRGHSEQTFKIPTPLSILKVEVTDRLLMIRSARRIDLFALDAPEGTPIRRTRESNFMREGALLGETSILFVDDTNSLFLADDTGEHALGKLTGFPIFSVSPDRRRVALAIQESVTIYDDHGKTVETFPSTSGPIRALAWSPDLRTLAVSARDGVELWTIPR